MQDKAGYGAVFSHFQQANAVKHLWLLSQFSSQEVFTHKFNEGHLYSRWLTIRDALIQLQLRVSPDTKDNPTPVLPFSQI